MAIMTSVSKFSKSSKRLRTTFEAFKFPASDTVQFRALITPCLSSCKPVQCNLMNMETGINQEFISYGKRRRKRSSHDILMNEQPNPEVVVVGAIRIKDTFDFETSSGSIPSSGLTRSPVSHEDPLVTTEEPSDLGTLLDPLTIESAKCSDLIGLGLASVVFLFGQLILLIGWYYMYQKVRMLRAKMSSLSSESDQSDAGSSSNLYASGLGLSRVTKVFPSKYLFPTTFSSSASSSCSSSRGCHHQESSGFYHSPPSSSLSSGSKHSFLLTPDKINDFMSKRNFNHPWKSRETRRRAGRKTLFQIQEKEKVMSLYLLLGS